MSTSKKAKRLLEMQEQLEQKKTLVAQTEGELTQLKSQMKERHDCATLKQASAKLKKTGEAIDDMETRFVDGVQELEEGYEWS
jgi:hypothetical protein